MNQAGLLHALQALLAIFGVLHLARHALGLRRLLGPKKGHKQAPWTRYAWENLKQSMYGW